MEILHATKDPKDFGEVVMMVYIKDYINYRKIMIKQQFYKFKLNVYEQKSMVKELMEAAGIQQGIDDYDAETYLPLVQNYCNHNCNCKKV